jgi:hypothetical protein
MVNSEHPVFTFSTCVSKGRPPALARLIATAPPTLASFTYLITRVSAERELSRRRKAWGVGTSPANRGRASFWKRKKKKFGETKGWLGFAVGYLVGMALNGSDNGRDDIAEGTRRRVHKNISIFATSMYLPACHTLQSLLSSSFIQDLHHSQLL